MDTLNNKTADVLVVGAGIIGLAVAEQLVSRGVSVALIEREAVAAGASQGNAAGLAFSDIMPLASPGMVRKAIKWLLDPLGPFAVVPRDIARTFPWLLRFLYASRKTQFERSIVGQAALMELGQASFDGALARANLQRLVSDNGALHLYQSMADYHKDLKNWRYRATHGIEFQRYEGRPLHDFQHGLAATFQAGIFVPSWRTLSSPADYCHALKDYLQTRGVPIIYEDVNGVDPQAQVHFKSGRQLKARQVVIAAGPWSARLCRQLGDKVPMVAERGYNTTLPRSALPQSIKRTLVFSEHGFVLTPLVNGYRIGGASEIARLGRSANFRRSRVMADKASRFLPGLELKCGKEWMGARPSTPDTLPVIDYSSRSKKIVYAFGHGHLGLTQSTATGQLVAELLLGEAPAIDLEPLRVKRFQ